MKLTTKIKLVRFLIAAAAAAAASSHRAHAGFNLCTPDQRNACFNVWTVETHRWELEINRLQDRKLLLPHLIPGCRSQASALAGNVISLSQELGAAQGRVEKELREADFLSKALDRLSGQEKLVQELDPLVQESTPKLILQIRTVFESQEATLDSQAAVLLDEIDKSTSEDEKLKLKIQLNALMEVKALREIAPDGTTIREWITSAMQDDDDADRDNLVSPLTRELFRQVFESDMDFKGGSTAYIELKHIWTESIASLTAEQELNQKELEADRTAQAEETALLDRFRASLQDQESVCSALEEERDHGIDDEISAATQHWLDAKEGYRHCESCDIRSPQ